MKNGKLEGISSYDRVSSLTAQNEICAIFQLCPHASSSFEHSFSSMMAYTNLHRILSTDNAMSLEA
jgi:hypothetical protein